MLDVAELPPAAAAAVLSAAEAGGGEAGHVLLAMRLTMTDGSKHVSTLKWKESLAKGLVKQICRSDTWHGASANFGRV
jgi:hypothetical protein